MPVAKAPITILSVVSVFFSCSDASRIQQSATWGTLITGSVVTEEGTPISGARIVVADGRIAETFQDGTFRLRFATMSGVALLRINAPGFSPGFKLVALNGMPELLVQVVLNSNLTQHEFPIAEGVTVQAISVRGEIIEVTIPPHSLVDEHGSSVNGNVTIELAEYDPQTAPGVFVGITTVGDSIPLVSFGMWSITVAADDGRSLRLRPSSGATYRIASPATEGYSPNLWTLDESTGVWIEDPSSRPVGMGGVNGLEADLLLPLYCNLDMSYQRGCVCGYVVDALGEATCGYEVRAEAVNWYGILGTQSIDHTDIHGRYCVEGVRLGTVEISVVGHPSASMQVVIPDVEGSVDQPATCGDGPNFYIPLKAATVCPVCGDGLCHAGEGPPGCPEDCGGTRCGNGVCEPDETYTDCPDDCIAADCGNGYCESDESQFDCPEDCASECGDGVCDPDENASSCPADCASTCGDGVCDSSEGFGDCPADCSDICESDEGLGCIQTWDPCIDGCSNDWIGCISSCQSEACDCNCGGTASSCIGGCFSDLDACITVVGLADCPSGDCSPEMADCCDGTLRTFYLCLRDNLQQAYSCN